MTRVLIAPDKFKGSLTASAVATAVADGMRSASTDLLITTLPVADGGEGTVDAAVAAGYRRIAVTATGPTGVRLETSYARRGDRAVVELADVCGLFRLPDGVLAPLTAGSRGVGEVLAAALDAGCTDLVLGIGGSAGTDGGAGMVSALGARLLTDHGGLIADGGAGLADVHSIDLAGLHPGVKSARITLACDVDNPLIGPYGAAAIYGPQKGASAADVRLLDDALHRWADAVEAVTGTDRRATPGAGAAGGVGFAAMSLLGAVPAPGIGTVFDIVGFADRLATADLVVTGEGSLDEQTLSGKAPAGVAAAARRSGIPVVAVCGRNQLTETDWRAAGFRQVYDLAALEPDSAISMRDAVSLLQLLGERISHELPGLLSDR